MMVNIKWLDSCTYGVIVDRRRTALPEAPRLSLTQDLRWPAGRVEGLQRSELRATAKTNSYYKHRTQRREADTLPENICAGWSLPGTREQTKGLGTVRRAPFVRPHLEEEDSQTPGVSGLTRPWKGQFAAPIKRWAQSAVIVSFKVGLLVIKRKMVGRPASAIQTHSPKLAQRALLLLIPTRAEYASKIGLVALRGIPHKHQESSGTRFSVRKQDTPHADHAFSGSPKIPWNTVTISNIPWDVVDGLAIGCHVTNMGKWVKAIK